MPAARTKLVSPQTQPRSIKVLGLSLAPDLPAHIAISGLTTWNWPSWEYAAPHAGPVDEALDCRNPGRTVPGMSAKEAAHAIIDALPEEATLQDVADRLVLLAALEKGRQAVREGRWKAQEDVEKLLPSWLEK